MRICRLMLDALAVEGRALEGTRGCWRWPRSSIRSRTRAAPSAAWRPHSRCSTRPAADAASFKGEIARVRATIDPSGDVVDDASPQLRAIRDRLRRQRTRLRGTLESYLRGKDTAKYLQDQVVTERNGRYVLVVKAEHRSGIPGIVHGASASGASLYLEPLSTVEINNDIVALEEQEAEEVRRILLALTDAFRARPLDIARTVEAATELDVLQARARFSESIDGIEPRLSTDGAFELQAARHPLLKAPVPVTIKIIPPATSADHRAEHRRQDRGTQDRRAARADGAVGAADSRGRGIAAAGVPDRLRRHRRRAVDRGQPEHVLRAHHEHRVDGSGARRARRWSCSTRSASGTDPIEGGALGVAVVDHFRMRGATVIATSHYDALKTYASTTEGVTRRGVRLRPANVRADLRAALRIAGTQPGARDCGAPRAQPVGDRGGAPESERARGAAGRAPGEDRPRPARARARAASRRPRARDARGGRGADAPARRGAQAARGDVRASG